MQCLSPVYFKLGKAVQRLPLVAIGACLLLTGAACVGFLYASIHHNPHTLLKDTDASDDFFRDHYDDDYRVNQVILTNRDGSDDVLGASFLEEALNLQLYLQEQVVLYDNMLRTFDSYCFRTGSECFINSPLQYWHMNATLLKSDSDVKRTVQQNTNVAHTTVLGGVSCVSQPSTACTPCQVQAEALVLTFYLNDVDGAAYWEDQVFKKSLDKFNNDKTKRLKATYFNNPGAEEHGLFYVGLCYLCVCLYAGLALGDFPSLYHTRFLVALALLLLLAAVNSIAFGLTFFLGWSTSSVALVWVPLLVLILGFTHAGILMHSFKQFADTKDPAPAALQQIGPSLSALALGETAFLLLGLTLSSDALASFCFTASAAVLVNHVFQLTAFVGVLCLDARRVSSQRLDCFPCFDLSTFPEYPNRCLLKSVLKRFYSALLSFRVLHTVIIGAFVACVIYSCFEANALSLGFSPKVASKASGYYAVEDEYNEAGPTGYILLKEVNYTDPVTVAQIETLVDSVATMKSTADAPIPSWLKRFRQFLLSKNPGCNNTDLWVYPFEVQLQTFLRNEGVCCAVYGLCGNEFTSDIEWEDGRVVSSRFRFFHKKLSSQHDYRTVRRDLKHAVKTLSHEFLKPAYVADLTSTVDWTESSESASLQSNHRALVYSPLYKYYLPYDSLRGNILASGLVGLAAATATFQLVSFNAVGALLVLGLTICTIVELLAFCYLWNEAVSGYNIEVNVVSGMLGFCCVIFCLEYFAILCLNACIQIGKRTDRVRKALITMGRPLLSGSVVAQLLILLVLGLAPYDLYQTYYFPVFLGVTVLVVLNAFMVEPILLLYSLLANPKPRLQDIQIPLE